MIFMLLTNIWKEIPSFEGIMYHFMSQKPVHNANNHCIKYKTQMVLYECMDELKLVYTTILEDNFVLLTSGCGMEEWSLLQLAVLPMVQK